MKGKGGSRLKHIISMMSSVTRAKCMAIRTKTDAVKARLMVTAFTLLAQKRNFSIGAISAKINNAIDGILNHHSDDTSKAVVLYSNAAAAGDATTSCCEIGEEAETSNNVQTFDGDDDDKYPDLRHTLFDEEDEEELAELLDDPSSSISAIEIVKNSKEDGDNFNLEDEIDEVADLFITKFHKRMRLQKLLSFKRHQQMIERSA